MLTQLYTLAFLAVFTQSVFADSCSRTYQVQEDDTCDGISAAQNVSTYQLAAVNPSINKDCTNLQPKQQICLGMKGEDCSTTYVVQPGDTCTKIAEMSNLNMTIFTHNNPQLDTDLNKECDIYVGEVLCTAGTVQVPATPANGIAVSMDKSSPASTDIPMKTALPTAAVVTPAPAHTTPSSKHKPNANVVNTSPDDDDDDLPFCDEL